MPLTGAIPENIPLRTASAGKIGSASQLGSQVGEVTGEVRGEVRGQPMTLQNANVAAFEAANKVLGESGRHIESLGSDALNR